MKNYVFKLLERASTGQLRFEILGQLKCFYDAFIIIIIKYDINDFETVGKRTLEKNTKHSQGRLSPPERAYIGDYCANLEGV